MEDASEPSGSGKSKATLIGSSEASDIDGLVSMMQDLSLELEKKGPFQVTLPFEVILYTDNERFTYVRIRVLLLSGATMDSTTVSVDASGWFLILKYKMPEVWTSLATVQQLSTDGDWDADDSNLEYALGMYLDKVKTKYDSQAMYVVQYIKLPVRCDLQLCDAAGKKVFVKLYEHETSDFRSNEQYYSILHANLISVDKPAKEHNTVEFSKSNNPCVHVQQPANPFV